MANPDPISDRLAISDLLTHYSHCLDSRQLELLASEVFAVDADVDYGWGRWTSGREVADWMIATFEDFAGTMHALSNERIQLDGDAATSTCCVQAYHWLPAEPGADLMRPADFVFAGMYEDRHRRTADGWRIAWRRFRMLGDSSLAVGALPDFMRLQRERD
ncbi:MAG: nuclear transport factor 2 family protein [Solirubrobacterales bacterium]